jgi:hypothetical protein
MNKRKILSFTLLSILTVLFSKSALSSENQLIITDVTPSQFSVVWLAGEPAKCSLTIFSDKDATNDITNQFSIVSESYNHPPAEDNGVMKVTVKNALPDTTYFFKTITTFKENNLKMISDDTYVVNTEIEASVISNNSLIQEIKNADKSNAPGVLLLASVENGSSPLSAWTGDGFPDSFAGVDLSNLYHSESHTSYDISSGTSVQLMAYGGLLGYYTTIGQTINEEEMPQIIHPIAVLQKENTNNEKLPVYKAIIVASSAYKSYQNDALWNTTKKIADSAYQVLLTLGYNDNNILYLSPEIDSLIVDQTASIESLFDSLNFWANGTDRLTLFMIGSGGKGYFNIKEKEMLEANDLDLYLDNLQINNPKLEVLFVYDSSFSGSFNIMNPPEKKTRFIITSCSSDEMSVFYYDGRLSFSYSFWMAMYVRDSLYNTFNHAASLINNFQTPQINSNGNDTPNENIDFLLAKDFYMSKPYEYLFIDSVSSSQSLIEHTYATIWAKNILSKSDIDRVWAVIKPPGYDENFSDDQQMEFPEIELEYNSINERYEATYPDFINFGEYKIIIYISDILGNVSSGIETKVYQQSGSDIYETDDSFGQANIVFIGNQTSQEHNFHKGSDTDYFKFYGLKDEAYTFETYQSGTQCDTVITLYDIDNNALGFKNNNINAMGEQFDWMCMSDGIYYVKINHFDPMAYGLNTNYKFRIYHPYAGIGIDIKGKIYDINSMSIPISNAIITTDDGQAVISSKKGNFIIFNLQSGIYTITAKADGYETYSTVIHLSDSSDSILIDIPMKSMQKYDYAIIVGASDELLYEEYDELWKSTKKCMIHACRALEYLGYPNENIKIISPDSGNIEQTMSPDNLQKILNDCAVNAKSILLYMVGHGGKNGYFILKERTYLEAEVLNGYLDTIQQNNSQLNRVILIIDSCFSGSFLPLLTPPDGKNRIIITSSNKDQDAVFKHGGTLSFSYQFWSQIFDGVNLYSSLSKAGDMMNQHQKPQFDFDGDGIANEHPDDKLYDIFIGNLPPDHIVFADHNPWFEFKTDDIILNNSTSQSFWVSNLRSNEDAEKVWAYIIPPDKSSSNFSFESIELTDPEDDGKFEGFYDNFSEPGTYTVVCYASYEKEINGYLRTIYSLPEYIQIHQPGLTTITEHSLINAILGLQILSGAFVDEPVFFNDEKITLENVITILKEISSNKTKN